VLGGVFGFVLSSSFIFATVASVLNPFPDSFLLSFFRIQFLLLPPFSLKNSYEITYIKEYLSLLMQCIPSKAFISTAII